MSEPQTVNCGIIVPNTGDLVGTWGSAAVNPDFVALDGYLGGVQTVSLSSSPVTLSSPAGFTPTPGGGPTQSQNGVLRLTGSISANITVTLPLPGYIIIENLTTNSGSARVVQFRAIGSGEVVCIDQGAIQHVYNDGTNVRFVNLPPVGTYMDYAGSSTPLWLTACTKPPYLVCDGSAFSSGTYPYLGQLLQSSNLPDFRGRASYYLNGGTGRLTSGGAGIDGNTLFASGGNNGLSLNANQIPSITSSGSMNSPLPDIVTSNQNTKPFSSGTGGSTQWFAFDPSSVQAIGTLTVSGTVTSTNTGTTNIQNAAPGSVSGLRLIRAG